MKLILHWQREISDWRTRVAWLDASERAGGGDMERREEASEALKNPLKFNARHLRNLESNRKNLTSEDKRNFADMTGYFLSLNLKAGEKNLPPQMLVLIEKSPLFLLLPKKMRDQIKGVLDRQMQELVEFSQKSIDTPSMATRAAILYRRLRKRAHGDDTVKPAFDAVRKSLIEWSINRLRQGSVAGKVKDALEGESKGNGKPLKKSEKLVIAEVYRMFPQSDDWVDNCDAQAARELSKEALKAVKENPSDPTVALSWNLIDEWRGDNDTEMLSALGEAFTDKELEKYLGRTRVLELFQFSKTQMVFLPTHLRALQSIKKGEDFEILPYTDADWAGTTIELENIKKKYKEEKDLEEKLKGTSVIDYFDASEERKAEIQKEWEEANGVADISQIQADYEKYAEFLEEKETHLKDVWENQFPEWVDTFKKEWTDEVLPMMELEIRESAEGSSTREKLEKTKQYITDKVGVFDARGEIIDSVEREKMLADFEDSLSLLKYNNKELSVASGKTHERIKKWTDAYGTKRNENEDARRELWNEFPISKEKQAEWEVLEAKISETEEQLSRAAQESELYKEWRDICINPQKKAASIDKNFWAELNQRLIEHKLNAADFEILWHRDGEFDEEVAEKIQNLPDSEKINNFRKAFAGALDGIFDGLALDDDKYENCYVALDEKLSYENIINRLAEQGFDIKEAFPAPQQFSELIEGAITNFRSEIFEQIRGKISEDRQDEFYTGWDRLHGRLSAPVSDPTVVAAEHSRYEGEKSNVTKMLQQEQEKNLSIIDSLRERALTLVPGKRDQLNAEADKLEAAWEVRKKWYQQGGSLSVLKASGETEQIWAPGKVLLNEMTLQTGGVTKEIIKISKEIRDPIFEIKEAYLEMQKFGSDAEKSVKHKKIKAQLEDVFSKWPGQKNSLKKLLKDHETVLRKLLPDNADLGHQFVDKIFEEAGEWLDTIDDKIHAWKKDARGCDYNYHGDEQMFRLLPESLQGFEKIINFRDGKFAENSEKLDAYLENDTETVEFLDEANFFEDDTADRRDFRKKYDEMSETFRSNVNRYESQFGQVRRRLQKDMNKLSDEEFETRYGGLDREYMNNLIAAHDNQLDQFHKGASKFLEPSFFNSWLRKYNHSPDSRANALDDMSQFRGLTTWAVEAKDQAENMSTWIGDWDNSKTKNIRSYQRFSLYDIYALVKQAVEVNRRRWERKSERAVANMGESFFGRKSPWGKEFHRKAQETEEARVKEIQGEINEDPWWEIQDVLYTTNDPDEAKACINELIDKGVFRWDDPKLWKTLMRLSGNAVNFSDSDMQLDLSEILKKCRNVCEFIWSTETFRQWDSTLESKIKSKEDEFAEEFQRSEHHPSARALVLQNMLERWTRGDRSNTDPAKYGLFLRKAFELGKLNGGPLYDTRWYFLTQGVKHGILSRDFFGRLNGELLANMPYFDFFVDKSQAKKDGRLVPEGTPGSHKGGWTYQDYVAWADFMHKPGEQYSVETARKRTKNFFYEIVLQSEESRARVERMVRNGSKTFDHDDGSLFGPGLGVESIRQMLNKTSTDEDKYTPDFWRAVMAGYVPYINGISKFIREGDAKYGKDHPEWMKTRKRNFAQVADKMQAMLLVFHSVIGNVNLTNREPVRFSDYDFEKSEEMSPSAAKSMAACNEMMSSLLQGAGKKEDYKILFNQNEWLASKGELPPDKASGTLEKKNGKDGKGGDPDHISVKLYDLIKGPEGKEVFSAQNMEQFLLGDAANIEVISDEFTGNSEGKTVEKKIKLDAAEAGKKESSEKEEGDNMEFGMTG